MQKLLWKTCHNLRDPNEHYFRDPNEHYHYLTVTLNIPKFSYII